MKHPDISELFLYIDGELDRNKKREIEKHLEICEKCREEISFIKKVDEIIIDSAPAWEPDNFINMLDLSKRQKRHFGLPFKKLVLGFLLFLALSLPVIGILRTTYEEGVQKEFQVLIEEHKAMGIEGVVPIKWQEN